MNNHFEPGRVWLHLALLAILLCLIGCVDPASKLINYGRVPRFTMLASDGRSFDSEVLHGKVWVVDFVYTSCPGPCPLMTSRMHALQKEYANDEAVRFVSISVDPQNDTPAVLQTFARQFGGPAADWYFLTGTAQTVHLLAHDVFRVGDVIQQMDHSTKFMLVDKKGDLRGYYSSEETDDGIDALKHDLQALERQRT